MITYTQVCVILGDDAAPPDGVQVKQEPTDSRSAHAGGKSKLELAREEVRQLEAQLAATEQLKRHSALEVRELETQLAAGAAGEQFKKRPPQRQTIDHEAAAATTAAAGGGGGATVGDNQGADGAKLSQDDDEEVDDTDQFFGTETFQDSNAEVRVQC